MAVQAKFRQLKPGTRWTDRVIELVFSANYVAGGDALDLRPQALTNRASELLGGAGSYDTVPDTVIELNSSGGYYFEVIQNGNPAALNTYLLKVYQPSGAELGAGAYPAALAAPASPFLAAMTHKTLR